MTIAEQRFLRRTHGCGELRAADAGQRATLAGWVARVRDHGGLVFVDLRDRTGIVQLVMAADRADASELAERARQLRSEFVIGVAGEVRMREPGLVNPKLATGEIEVWPNELIVYNQAKTPPFAIEDDTDTDEMLRLRYRYLDLRRPEIQRNLVIRHRMAQAIRNYLDCHGFLEIETPVLTRSTPEGARDYLVPSRVNPGKFYALPQSPQLFKQLLMVAGYDRYYQIVRCFRDEDLRADRQPEFTQVDIELSFVDVDDVLEINEGLVCHVYREILGFEPPRPFRRLSYQEAMARFGTDKPDLRIPLELAEVTDLVADTSFKVFQSVAASGGSIVGLRVPGAGSFSRKELDDLTAVAAARGARGLAWLVVPEGGAPDPNQVRSSFARFLNAGELNAVIGRLEGQAGDLLLFVADKTEIAQTVLGHLRVVLGQRLDLVDHDRHELVWITDFPLLEWDEDEKRWVARHHPFTSPRDEDLERLESDPASVRAKAYDLVLNGTELGGGSIRIHRRDVQERVLAALAFSREEAVQRFGFLLEAFEYGTPPHGGIAFGFDRWVMIFAGRQSIRDVIAFPKTARANDLMTGAPAAVDAAQLTELHVRVAQSAAAATAALAAESSQPETANPS